MSGHLLKGLAVKCSRQLPFSYQFAGVGQENQRNVDKLTLNGSPVNNLNYFLFGENSYGKHALGSRSRR